MPAESNLILHQMELGPMENFVYLVGDSESREAAVVDPAWDVEAILRAARDRDLSIKTILITHTHFDHINGVEALLNETDARVFVHKVESGVLQYSSNIKKIESGDSIRLGSLEVTFIHTPGHTPGSQCFHVADRLITGDTLFINGCGRCDLPGGDPREMYESLARRLSKLDDQTIIYPGHHYAEVTHGKLGDERRRNPYLLAGSLDGFLKMMVGG